MRADLVRVLKKGSFRTMLIITMILVAATGLPSIVGAKENTDTYFAFITMLNNFSNLFIGIPVFLAVYSDDFKSRAMQTVIGFGVSRSKLIICRLLEVIIIVAMCYAILSLEIFVLKLISGASTKVFLSCIKELWSSEIMMVADCSICMIIVYVMQNATLALVTYILIESGAIGVMLGLASMIPLLKNHNIQLGNFLPNYVVTKMMEGEAFAFFVVILGYIALPLYVTMKIFNSKELEF